MRRMLVRSGGADLVPGLMARHLDWSPGPLPGLRLVTAWSDAASRSKAATSKKDSRGRTVGV
jgi:hypothetical protein